MDTDSGKTQTCTTSIPPTLLVQAFVTLQFTRWSVCSIWATWKREKVI